MKLIEILSDIGPTLVGLAALVFSFLQVRKTFRSSVRQMAIQDERKEIYKKLNGFYGPLLQLRKKSEMLYRIFNQRFNGQHFRTLNYLLEKFEFTENERALLHEIINIGKECEVLVHRESGLIDDDTLRNELIPKLTTHILILRLAYEGKLEGNPSDFDKHTFPRGLDETIEKKINSLQERLEELNNLKH